MVLALLSGRKSQTRRKLKPQPGPGQHAAHYSTARVDWQIRDRDGLPVSSHRFRVREGARLWVREAWKFFDWTEEGRPFIRYRADGAISPALDFPERWSGQRFIRVGKKNAGRMLDGISHHAFPVVCHD